MLSSIRVGLIGDFNHHQRAHYAIPNALRSASDHVEVAWISSDAAATGESLADFDGFWCVPGMPYSNPAGVLRAIRFAREHRIPFIGSSAGFQYALIEYARNAVGLAEAGHQKVDPRTPMPLVTPHPCGLCGVKARVRVSASSRLRQAYGATESIEEYHCSFGLNSRYRRLLESRDLYVAAVDDQHDIRAIELDDHPFFVATLFQPELRPDPVNPLAAAFLAACNRLRKQAVRTA
jgi:CTP synthase (UTP-ammonia lyase)